MADELVERIAGHLVDRGWRIAVAETTAGGLISARLLATPGASKWFDRGVVAYSGAAKRDSLGVDAAVLKEFGSVSVEAARAMATALRRLAGADVAVAETGIAGPITGRSPKPVGSVAFAVVTPAGEFAEEISLPGDRRAVMEGIVEAVLARLAIALEA